MLTTLRTSNYRIVYRVEDQRLLVLPIGHRREIYR
jgi:mRNA-degrading endonuclease RelE of RelBE toxin-antitoxin system